MKKGLLAASALLMILAPTLSVAQEHHEGEGRPGRSAPPAARSAPPPGRGPGGPPPGAGYHGPAVPQGPAGAPHPGDFRPAPGGAPLYAQGAAPRAGAQPFGYGGRQFFRYRAAPYVYPSGFYGWSNHAWRRGEWLPPVFISSAYFINDWYDFGLWQPSYGYQWIRVGPDAVLINLADGQVVDVVPGVYYY